MPDRYRKRPVEIEAIQWNGSDGWADAIVQWITAGDHTAQHVKEPNGFDNAIAINTLEGVMHAMPGDWVIKGVKGEFYPCKPSVFDATYERVSP